MKRFWLLLFAITFFLCGCTQKSAERQIYIMDTVVDMKAYGDRAEESFNEVENMLNRIEDICSPTDAESQINCLNRAGERGLEISDELAAILQKSRSAFEDTGGAFNMFMGELIKLWDIGGGNAKIPTDAEIASARSRCNAAELEVSGNQANIHGGAQINLGGVAKGYAAGCAMELFDRLNVSSAIVSIGGNICVKGAKPDGTPWKIGVRDPFGTASDYIGVLELEDTVIAVSGGYERWSEIGGVRYHHILDPESGYPAESDIASVSVVCNDGARADALSTALFVMGRDRALELWRDQGDFECVIIDEDMRVTVTSRLADKFRLTDGRYTLESAHR